MSESASAWPSLVVFAAGLQLCFFGFIKDVLTDIRAYLKRISEK